MRARANARPWRVGAPGGWCVSDCNSEATGRASGRGRIRAAHTIALGGGHGSIEENTAECGTGSRPDRSVSRRRPGRWGDGLGCFGDWRGGDWAACHWKSSHSAAEDSRARGRAPEGRPVGGRAGRPDAACLTRAPQSRAARREFDSGCRLLGPSPESERPQPKRQEGEAGRDHNVTGALGPSGCGKTTLMRSIVGVGLHADVDTLQHSRAPRSTIRDEMAMETPCGVESIF